MSLAGSKIAGGNPKDGRVEGVIDCRGLLPKELYRPDTDVLNGIAYDPATKKIYLTGKNWPRLYEVRLVKKKESSYEYIPLFERSTLWNL